MYVMGMMATGMISYYMGMPKNRRESLKDKMKDIMSVKDSE